MSDFIYFVNNNLLLCVAWVAVALSLLLVYLKESLHGAKQLSVVDMTQMMNQQDAVVYDLRGSTEYNQGHITQAVNFNFSDVNNLLVLQKKIEEMLKSDSEKPVILVCKDGLQSKQQAYKLKTKGIKNICYLNGGMASWTSEGLPTIS